VASIARRAASFAAIAIVVGLVFEAGMRLAGGSEAAPVFQELFMPDARIGHRPRPGARIHYVTSEFATDIAINSAGVRGPEIADRLPNERRVVVLGDSLVLSVQVDLAQTFCQVLERRLNARRDGSTYRVINAGVQGYGPVEEWLFFQHVVSPLKPDVVLVAVFVANDAIESLDSAAKLDAGRDTVTRAREEVAGWSRRVVRRSMVLQTIRLRFDGIRRRFQQPGVAQRPLVTYLADPPNEVDRGLQLARDTLLRIERAAGAAGARTGFVLVPARFQLDDDDYSRLAATVRAGGGTLERDAATLRFVRVLEPLGVPLLDLLPVLRSQPDPARLFFRENIHFTPRGHRVVAGALERFLLTSPLLSGNDQPQAAAHRRSSD
jgi:lysophospholipase L1-like esterase